MIPCEATRVSWIWYVASASTKHLAHIVRDWPIILDYSSKDHEGFDHVIPKVIRGGRAVLFTDWSTAAPK